jgi:hypothetical protein
MAALRGPAIRTGIRHSIQINRESARMDVLPQARDGRFAVRTRLRTTASFQGASAPIAFRAAWRRTVWIGQVCGTGAMKSRPRA